MKKFWKWLVSIIGVFVLLVLFASTYFFHVAEVRSDDNDPYNAVRQPGGSLYQLQNSYNQRQHEVWNQTASDGLKLKAWYTPANGSTSSNKTVVIAHGWHDDHRKMEVYGEIFLELGYNVLIPDDRAAGESQGVYIGYGWLDRKDYLNWINQVIDKEGTNQNIVMMGMSMGGATTMMVSGESNLPQQVKAFIEDSGYTSVYDETVHEASDMFGMPKWIGEPMVKIVSFLSKLVAGYSYQEANSLKAVEKNTRPMLFFHGGSDTFVPTDMVNQVYAANKTQKDLWIAPNAKHVQSLELYPQEYKQRVADFLNKIIQ